MLSRSKYEQSVDMLAALLLNHCRKFRLLPVDVEALSKEMIYHATSAALDVFEKGVEETTSPKR